MKNEFWDFDIFYIYIYISIYIYLSVFPNKRSFKGSGGVRGLDSQHQAQICARELASVASRGGEGGLVAPRLSNTKIVNSKVGRGIGHFLNFASYQYFPNTKTN